jgi:hypothetical protein
MARLSASAMAVVLAAGAGCTGSTNDGGRATSATASTTTIDPRCRSALSSTSVASGTSLPPACQDQQFRAVLAEPRNAAAAALGFSRALRLSESLCAYATTLPEQEHPPTFDQLMSSNASTWKVTKKAALAISRAAQVLCPDGIGAVYGLAGGSKPLKVSYRVDGTGAATVVYTSGDDSFTQERITAPWSRTVDATSRGVISILATPAKDTAAPMTCSITIGGEQVDDGSSTDPDNGGIAACSVPIAIARRAAG